MLRLDTYAHLCRIYINLPYLLARAKACQITTRLSDIESAADNDEHICFSQGDVGPTIAIGADEANPQRMVVSQEINGHQ